MRSKVIYFLLCLTFGFVMACTVTPAVVDNTDSELPVDAETQAQPDLSVPTEDPGTQTQPDLNEWSNDTNNVELPPQGGLNCKDLWICLILCPEGDQNCMMQCQQAASQEGLDFFIAVNNCRATACDDFPQESPAQSDCLASAQGEGGACYADIKACGLFGSGACNGILTCSVGCQQDATCAYKCLYEGSSYAQGLFGELQKCAQNACYQPGQPCNTDPQGADCGSCAGQNCPEEIATCQAHKDGSRGANTPN